MATFDVAKWDYETDWLTDAFEILHGELLQPKRFNADQWLSAFILLKKNLESSIDDLDDSNPLAANRWLNTRPRLHEYHEVMTRGLREMHEEWRGLTLPVAEVTEKHFRKNRAEFRAARVALKKVWMKDLKLGAEKLAAEDKDGSQGASRGLGITDKDGKSILDLFQQNKEGEESNMETERHRAAELLLLWTKLHKVQAQQEQNLEKSVVEEMEHDLEEGEIVDITATIEEGEVSNEEVLRLERTGGPFLFLAVTGSEGEVSEGTGKSDV